jgi:hypothetical protein
MISASTATHTGSIPRRTPKNFFDSLAFLDFLDGSSATSYFAHMMQAIKYSAIAGVVFWLLLILLIMALDYGDPIDEKKFPLPVQLIILFISLSQIVGDFHLCGPTRRKCPVGRPDPWSSLLRPMRLFCGSVTLGQRGPVVRFTNRLRYHLQREWK